MKVFKFNITGIVVALDTEYASYENQRFTNHGYNGHISIAMAKLNNLILSHPDFYLTDCRITETEDNQYRRKQLEPC